MNMHLQVDSIRYPHGKVEIWLCVASWIRECWGKVFALSLCPTMVSSASLLFSSRCHWGRFSFFSHYSYEFTSYKLWLHKLYVLKLMCFLICFVLFSHGFFRISIPTKLHKVLAACVVQCSCRCCCQWNRCLSSGMLGMILAIWCKRFLIKIPNNHM